MEGHVPKQVEALGHGSVLYVSTQSATRLVVFVHGFHGRAVETWREFNVPADRAWWGETDMLFVGYDSMKENTLSVVHRLMSVLPQLFPMLPAAMTLALGARIRPEDARYRELVLVGHSLGGVIVRRLLAETAREWDVDGAPAGAARPLVLDATAYLFSPASEGFLPKGWIGVAKELGMLRIADVRLRKAPAYSEVQPNSALLRETRKTTKRLVKIHGKQLDSLRASILWANPDAVVQVENYPTDRRSRSVDNSSHVKICKPGPAYQAPWDFVEGGRIP